MTKVSVIVPLLSDNREKYAVLDSLAHQSLEEMEVIRVTNRNAGIEQAKGKYVVFLHPDDILVFTALEKLYLAAETNDADIVAFSGVNVRIKKADARKKTAEVNETCLRSGEYPDVLSGKDMMCLLIDQDAYYHAVSLQLYRRAYLLENDIRFSDSAKDVERVFTFRSYLEADRVCVISDIYLYHCFEADLKQQGLEKRVEELQKALDDTKKQLKVVSEKKKKLESSRSYQIGKKVTYIPRKAKKVFGNSREKK